MSDYCIRLHLPRKAKGSHSGFSAGGNRRRAGGQGRRFRGGLVDIEGADATTLRVANDEAHVVGPSSAP